MASKNDSDPAQTNEEDYGESRKLPQYVAALSVCMGAVAAGTVLGWPANITGALEQSKLNDIPINDEAKGWIGSLISIGALIMCFPIGTICDYLGRKLAMLLLIVPFLLGWGLIIFAANVEMIYAGRFFTGLAGGAFCVSAPLYTTEIAQKEIRGALGTYFQLLLTVGILIAYGVGASEDPKVTAIVCGIFPIVFGVLFFLQPETPIYSAKKGDDKAALAALRKLRGPDYNIEKELRDIKAQLEKEEQNKEPFLKAVRTTAAKKAVLISFGLMVFQQLSGVNAVIMYTSDIFRSAGTSLDEKYATILVGVIQVIATFVASLVIDRFGRKILLLGSGALMAVSSFLLAIYFTLKDDVKLDQDTITNLGALPIIAMCLFIVVFSLGFGPIPWMISAEILPPGIKSVTGSAAATLNWFLAFLVTKFYGDLDSAIGGNTFYIFAGISLMGAFYVQFMCIETKGKTLAAIQEELGGDEKPLKSGFDNQTFSP